MPAVFDDWLLVNQACSSEDDAAKGRAVRVRAIEQAVGRA
jgi:hypothetical protein